MRSYLKERLPEYMIPSAFVMLESLPLTPNGKVDRQALPAPEQSRLEAGGEYVAPRDRLEIELADIWKELLKLPHVGIKDNFFELGGHSLLAVRLFALIEMRLGQKLPVAVLFEAATIEGLAERLRQTSTETLPSAGSLVRLQTGNGLLPFFCVHPAGGNILGYFDLARHMGVDRPFYAFQAQGLLADEAPSQSIEEMAAHYIGLMRKVQAEGPYLLGGWSLGGVVAFEMARQLEQQKQTISLLALIDSYLPDGTEPSDEDDLSLLLGFAQEMGLSAKHLKLSSKDVWKLGGDDLLTFVLERAREAGVVPGDITVAAARRLFDVYRHNVRALSCYRAESCGVRAVLFGSVEEASIPLAERANRWMKVASGGVQVETVPGTHNTLVREPNVRTLAHRLNIYLRQIDDESVNKSVSVLESA
jgi:thioesterase domain-containing protein/acyl carrier protein